MVSSCQDRISEASNEVSILTWHPILHERVVDFGYNFHGRSLIRSLDLWMIDSYYPEALKKSILEAIYTAIEKTRKALEKEDKNSGFYKYAEYKLSELEKMPFVHRQFIIQLETDEQLKNHIFDPKDLNNPLTKHIKFKLGNLLFDARGKWKEILAYQQFRDISLYDVRLKNLVSESAQKRALERKVTRRELNDMLEHEVDFVLSDGSWVEVKNYSFALDENSHLYPKLIQKAKYLSTMINYESEIQRRQIPLYFVFFGSGVSRKVVEELDSWGVKVIFRPSLVRGVRYDTEGEL